MLCLQVLWERKLQNLLSDVNSVLTELYRIFKKFIKFKSFEEIERISLNLPIV